MSRPLPAAFTSNAEPELLERFMLAFEVSEAFQTRLRARGLIILESYLGMTPRASGTHLADEYRSAQWATSCPICLVYDLVEGASFWACGPVPLDSDEYPLGTVSRNTGIAQCPGSSRITVAPPGTGAVDPPGYGEVVCASCGQTTRGAVDTGPRGRFQRVSTGVHYVAL